MCQDNRLEKSITRTEKHLQFAATLALFLPVLLEAFFNYSGQGIVETSGIVIKSGVVIFLFILNYLLFEWRKSKFSLRQSDYLCWVYVLTIICFAWVILFLGFVVNGDITLPSALEEFAYGFSVFGLMAFPGIGIVITLFGRWSESFRGVRDDNT